MNNNEKYKKALDQIHVSQELKEKTLKKSKNMHKKKIIKFIDYAVSIAAVVVFTIIGVAVYNKNLDENLSEKKFANVEKEIVISNDNLEDFGIRRFSNIAELKQVLSKNISSQTDNIYNQEESIITSDSLAESENKSSNSTFESDVSEDISDKDYSKTNNQVENVDEADIVKTDGNYIYYSQNSRIYIIDSENLELKAEIYEEDFSPSEIFINKDKLIVLGNIYGEYDTVKSEIYNSTESKTDICIDVMPKTKAVVKVYDISSISSPSLIREIDLDGYYINSRMIEDNIYFISSCSVGWSKNIENAKDEEILPSYIDTAISDEEKFINCTDIAYFENSEDYSYMLIGGFNLNNDKEVNIETFFRFRK
jgi:hypothetical protein